MHVDRRGKFNSCVASAVSDRRAAVGLTQKDVARQAGYTLGTYRNLEQNARAWIADDMRRVAEVLDTTASELMEDAEALYAEQTPDPKDHRAAEELRAALGFE